MALTLWAKRMHPMPSACEPLHGGGDGSTNQQAVQEKLSAKR